MTFTARAVVMREAGAPLRVEEILLPEPGPTEVRVEMIATGICHSDLSLARGILVQPVPAVLGHEGVGRVAAIGGDVTTVGIGDAVLLNWAPACRACWWCQRDEPYLCPRANDRAAIPYAQLRDGTPAFPGLNVAAFATHTVVSERSCIPIPQDINVGESALLGCAVLTGVGAVLHAATVLRGESVAVIGLGGVGLSAIQGARLAGASPIIAVDNSPDTADLARRLGATDFLEPGLDVAKSIRMLTEGRGVDHAIECVGRADTMRLAWSVTRRGGHATVVGLGSKSDSFNLNALEVAYFARTLQGCMFGNADPATDIPILLEHVRAGRLDLGALVTKKVTLDEVEEAFADMTAGRGARSLIIFD